MPITILTTSYNSTTLILGAKRLLTFLIATFTKAQEPWLSFRLPRWHIDL